jgi:hypothetical protein
MADKTQWILYLAGLGCTLSAIILILLLVRKRREDNIPPGDIGPITTSIDNANRDAATNQTTTLASIALSRTETRKASQGIRVQMESTQRDNQFNQEKSIEKLNFIKAMIARWFTVVPPPMPKDDTSTVHDDPKP